MLAQQNSLPHLPVPTIESTAFKYMETVRPHLDYKQFEHTQEAIRDFLTSPMVKTLQNRLEARADQPGMKNWLSDWWNLAAYMGYRDPVIIFVSYYYAHVMNLGKAWIEGDSPSLKAALLLKGILSFRQLVESQQLTPDKIKDKALCMDSYQWLFNACRIPTKPADTATKYSPESHNHIIFIRNNRFYEVETRLSDGSEMSVKQLEAQIDRIKAHAGSSKGVPIGVLTSENRDTWTDARNTLLKSTKNSDSLKRIESAVIVVPLDSTSPSTREDVAWTMWTGDGRNRFYDKHQLIFCDNGRSGFLGEHSCLDGTATLRMNEFVLGAVDHGRITASQGSSSTDGLPEPKELQFDIDPKSAEFIKQAEANFEKLVGDHELEVLHYSKYGSRHIKAHRTSPDAFAQLVKQLAFYKLYQRPGVTYESTQTRRFQLGRTEVLRSASYQSKEWVTSMVNPNVSDRERFRLFQQAASRHVQYASWASSGQGVDRHLFGLKKLLQEGEEVPKLFQDGAYAETGHWELSTSQLSSPYFDGWGYGEVVPDGYGLSYAIGPEYVRWGITCSKTHPDGKNRHGQPWKNASEMKKALQEAADETSAMLEAGNPEKIPMKAH